jgi:hypothetical protein
VVQKRSQVDVNARLDRISGADPLWVSHQAQEFCGSPLRNSSVHKHTSRCTSLAELCRAVDLACIWYGKTVLCLQRSAAATCLLRRHGIPAQLVIGTQQIPFNAHAWVEVEGQVVSDRPYMHEMYAVLERI